MKVLTALIAMVGLIAAAGLDSERWVLCLAIAMGCGAWVVAYGVITGWKHE